MMRVVILAWLMAACGDTQPAPGAPTEVELAEETRAARAARIATAIRAAPDEADAILAAEGLDRDSFEALIVEIAEDADDSAEYAAALGS